MITIAIIGQPNAGKSTLFNVLSDIKVETSNFAGTSVKIVECLVNLFGETIKLVDLPGLYSLNPSDAAEQVTIDYLKSGAVDLIINVVDSTLLARSLELSYEISEFGLPSIIALNMIDEARAKGLEVYPEKLAEIFKHPVVPISAIYGKGVKDLLHQSVYYYKNYKELHQFKFTGHIDSKVTEVEELFRSYKNTFSGSDRFYAIKSLENQNLVPQEFIKANYKEIVRIQESIISEHNTDIFEVFSYERHHLAMKTAEVASKFVKKNNSSITDNLDKFLMHPIYGYFGFAIFNIVLFVLIFYVGDFLSGLMERPIELIMSLYKPLKNYNLFLYTTVDGIAQGVIGAIGIVLPYFLPLVLINSIFEETGYLSRIAFLIDNFMHRIGLHGKSVAAFIMGVGCSVPAIYATRVLDSRRDRILTAILIPFVPCSARIAVIFALTAAFAGPIWAIVVFLFVIIVIAINGKILSKFMKKPTGLILEMPQLRVPSLSISFRKTVFKINDFLKEALPFLILGSVLLGWIELLNIAKFVDLVFYPILEYVLGLPGDLGSTLVFGFFRKELILVMANQAMGVDTLSMLPLTKQQVIVFVIFVTLYFPCFTTFVVLVKEFGAKIGMLSALLSVLAATISALIFRLYFVIINYLFY